MVRKLAISLGLGLSALNAVAAHAAAAERYPIWISPLLEIDRAVDVERRLERRFWPDHDPDFAFAFSRMWRGVETIEFARSCNDIRRLLNRGFSPPGRNPEWKLYLANKAICDAIALLRNAKPAKKSFVRGLRLDRSIYDWLPPFMAPTQGVRYCEKYEAQRRRESLGEFLGARPAIEHRRENSVKFENETAGAEIEIVIRADLLSDGYEDLAVIRGEWATEGTYGADRLFVLTRHRADGPLRVVDPETHLGAPDSQCRPEPSPASSGKHAAATNDGQAIPMRWTGLPTATDAGSLRTLYREWFNTFWFGVTIHMVHDDPRRLQAVNAESCAEYLGLRALGYRPFDDAPESFDQQQRLECDELTLFKRATASYRSAVRDYRLDRDGLGKLPAMVAAGETSDALCLAYLADDQGVPWSMVERSGYRVDSAGPDSAAISSPAYRLWITIRARADLSGDGWEDLLVRVSREEKSGYRQSHRLLVVTRRAPDEVLRLLSPGQYLRARFQCDPEAHDPARIIGP